MGVSGPADFLGGLHMYVAAIRRQIWFCRTDTGNSTTVYVSDDLAGNERKDGRQPMGHSLLFSASRATTQHGKDSFKLDWMH